MNRGKRALGYAMLAITVTSFSGLASGAVVAYPAKGQTPEKQAADTAACQAFAKSQTGFDPQQALENAPPPPAASTAVRPRKRAEQENKEMAAEGQEQQALQKKVKAYDNAESVCLKGRGYSVG